MMAFDRVGPTGTNPVSVRSAVDSGNGSFRLAGHDISWIDVAYRAPGDATLQTTIDATFSNRDGPEEGHQWWLARMIGLFNGSAHEDAPRGFLSYTYELGDEVVKARVRVGDIDQSVSVDDPYRRVDHNGDQVRIESEWSPAFEGPVVEHYLFGIGGEPFAEPLEFEFRADNATVNVTYGTDGTFVFDRADYNSTAYVRGDAPGGIYALEPAAQTEASLHAELVGSRPRTAFWFSPDPGAAAVGGEAAVHRPNGSTMDPAAGQFWAGSVDATGTWRFEITESVDRWASHPNLVGMRYRPTRLPQPTS